MDDKLVPCNSYILDPVVSKLGHERPAQLPKAQESPIEVLGVELKLELARAPLAEDAFDRADGDTTRNNQTKALLSGETSTHRNKGTKSA